MKVVKCRCGHHQVTNAVYSLKCKKCEKVVDVRKSRVLFFGSVTECSAFMNRERHEPEFVNYRRKE